MSKKYFFFGAFVVLTAVLLTAVFLRPVYAAPILNGTFDSNINSWSLSGGNSFEWYDTAISGYDGVARKKATGRIYQDVVVDAGATNVSVFFSAYADIGDEIELFIYSPSDVGNSPAPSGGAGATCSNIWQPNDNVLDNLNLNCQITEGGVWRYEFRAEGNNKSWVDNVALTYFVPTPTPTNTPTPGSTPTLAPPVGELWQQQCPPAPGAPANEPPAPANLLENPYLNGEIPVGPPWANVDFSFDTFVNDSSDLCHNDGESTDWDCLVASQLTSDPFSVDQSVFSDQIPPLGYRVGGYYRMSTCPDTGNCLSTEGAPSPGGWVLGSQAANMVAFKPADCQLIVDPIGGDYYECPWRETFTDLNAGSGGLAYSGYMQDPPADGRAIYMDSLFVVPIHQPGGLGNPIEVFCDAVPPMPTPTPTATPVLLPTVVLPPTNGTPVPVPTFDSPINVTPQPTTCPLSWEDTDLPLIGPDLPGVRVCFEPKTVSFGTALDYGVFAPFGGFDAMLGLLFSIVVALLVINWVRTR